MVVSRARHFTKRSGLVKGLVHETTSQAIFRPHKFAISCSQFCRFTYRSHVKSRRPSMKVKESLETEEQLRLVVLHDLPC